jgi:hypothetical protein
MQQGVPQSISFITTYESVDVFCSVGDDKVATSKPSSAVWGLQQEPAYFYYHRVHEGMFLSTVFLGPGIDRIQICFPDPEISTKSSF